MLHKFFILDGELLSDRNNIQYNNSKNQNAKSTITANIDNNIINAQNGVNNDQNSHNYESPISSRNGKYNRDKTF